jgi:hypothetical protein
MGHREKNEDKQDDGIKMIKGLEFRYYLNPEPHNQTLIPARSAL